MFEDQPSYKLEYIAYKFLGEGEGKVNYGEYSSIFEFYEKNYDKFFEYAIQDPKVIYNLENKLKLIETLVFLAYLMGCNIDTAMETVRPWAIHLRHIALKHNMVLPSDTRHHLDKAIVGGYVKEPIKGKHYWVISIDFNSLYPSIMDMLNLCATTYIPYDKLPEELKEIYKLFRDEDEEKLLNDEDLQKKIRELTHKYNVSFNGQGFFRKNKRGLIAETVAQIYYDRKKEKNRMLLANAILKNKKGNIELSVSEIIQKIENDEINWDNVYDIVIKDKDNSEKLKTYSNNKKTLQQALKILINSLYGALGNAAFVLFNRDIAAGITFVGRFLNRYTAKKVGEYLQAKYGITESVIYQDTDSTDYDTLIDVEGLYKITFEDGTVKYVDEEYLKREGNYIKIEKIKIGKLFDIFKENGELLRNEKGKYVIKPHLNIKAKSMNKNFEIEYKPIEYIMGHNVNKEMFEIRVKDKKVNITKDHSIIGKKDNKLVDIRPTEVKDVKLYCNGWTKDYEIKSLGIQNKMVFDIEVKDNHNFFGNDILLHNSDYIKIDKIVEKIITKKFNKPFEEFSEDEIKKLTDYILKFIEKEIQPVVDESVKEVQDILNAYHKGFVGAKVEKIMVSGIFVAKKKYAVAKIWEEGSYYTSPSLSVTGLDLVRSSTPEFAKQVFEKALEIMLLGNETELQNYLKNVKNEFNEIVKTPRGIKSVSRISGVNSLNYKQYEDGWYRYVYDENGNIVKKLPAPINSRASILHNKYIKDNNLEEKFELIEEGGKVNFVYLKTPNPIGENVIAFMDEDFLEVAGLINYVDKELQFEKIIEQPLKIISNVLTWELKKTSSLNGLF
jgi:DNA polymerase elongation subunit (family B)